MSDLQSNPSSPTVRPFNPDKPVVTVPPVFQEPAPIEGETALFYQHTEGTPPTEPPSRIPHLGHALLFLGFAAIYLLVIQLVFLGLGHHPSPAKTPSFSPKFLVGSEAISYIATLITAWFIFPLFWKRPFTNGLQLNPDAARRNALRLVPIGVVLSFSVQALSSLISLPKNIPIDDFFKTRSDVWLVTAFGIFLAPLFEEVLFRGFLLPAFAIAYDWLSLPRTPAAREAWHSTNKLTRASFVFSAVLTSIFFALLHGQQTAFTWPVLILLFCVSLILSYVRLRLRSVAASTLIHMSYNATIFLTAFIGTDGYRHLEKLAPH